MGGISQDITARIYARSASCHAVTSPDNGCKINEMGDPKGEDENENIMSEMNQVRDRVESGVCKVNHTW